MMPQSASSVYALATVPDAMRSVHRFAGIGLPDRRPGHYPIEQLLIPIEGTAYYIGATWLKPFATYGAFGITDEALAQSAAQYKALLAE